jgi:hypothetical protein
MSAVAWTFLSVDGTVIDVAVEDSDVVSDKNVHAAGDVIGARSPPAAMKKLHPFFCTMLHRRKVVLYPHGFAGIPGVQFGQLLVERL